ncbi:hypothetical protein C0995_004176 [Termitomyces sp. Mi166|nr:hypothetical protein C0995_004176 [Termitomyces sp. Mi166\
MTPALELRITDVIAYSLSLWLVSRLLRYLLSRRRRVQTTPLRGPPSQSLLFGLTRVIRESDDASLLTEQWVSEYGSAFCVPGALGSTRIVIVDPKAVSHFYLKESFGYVKTSLSKSFIEQLFGRGLLWAEGESHRRQRKALSPAFSNSAIRRLTSVFYDSSYKLKANWDVMLESSSGDGAIIDVQKWMNHVSLDSIGIAGFGHDFGSLDGKIPTSDNRQWAELHNAMRKIADDLLERTREEGEGLLGEKMEEKSIIGLLIKAENTNSQLRMSQEEVLAQDMKLRRWALIELARKPEKQHKLREELSRFSTADPTWEQLVSELPYLDSIAHEVLRLHPPVTDTNRVAAEDDIIPLSTPVVTATGETVSSIVVRKGTIVNAPIRTINQSAAFWGPNAKEFEPERWLDESDIPAKQFQGHRHILTFSDGPRICLGRHFALAEFKAALSVLIRNYVFELLDGPETKIEKHRSVLSRPKVAGQIGAKVPMKVKRVV